MTAHRVRKTRSGLFVRDDPQLGLLTYSPFTSLIYAVAPSAQSSITTWLDHPRSHKPSLEYVTRLGPGWAIPQGEAEHLIPQLLPNRDAWTSVGTPSRPLVINWFITGLCPLGCRYCYAEDLMRNKDREPDRKRIHAIADAILSFTPLVVVLTGGDPLFSPHLAYAIELLSDHVGLIVDTSAYTFTAEHLRMFKKHRIAVRISIDSERPDVNQYQRPPYHGYPRFVQSKESTLTFALRALCQCLDAGLSVGVQTVATQRTANDLPALGDKLFRLGVRSWRVLKVAPSASRYDGYAELVGLRPSKRTSRPAKASSHGPYEFIFRELLRRHRTSWAQGMGIQVTFNETPNAVILVGPDGTFYTESNISLGKVVLDARLPFRPSMAALSSAVNMQGHVARYLNLTSERLPKGGTNNELSNSQRLLHRP